MHERRRRQRLDRTNHRREIESRRADRRGPSERAIKKALDGVADHAIPGTPSVGSLQVLQHIHESEHKTGTRKVRDIKITDGDPMHGAHRSDDHIGRYEVEAPFSEVDPEVVPGDACPECGGERALYKYHAHHHIAGGESLWCPECEAQLHSNEWG